VFCLCAAASFLRLALFLIRIEIESIKGKKHGAPEDGASLLASHDALQFRARHFPQGLKPA